MFGTSSFAEAPFAALPTPQLALGISSVTATGDAGTINTSFEVALTGVAASGALGDVSVVRDFYAPLTSVQAEGQAGLVYIRYWADIDQGVTTTWTLINTDII